MYYSEKLQKFFPKAQYARQAERRAENPRVKKDRTAPAVTERSSDWAGTPTPEDSPPWGAHIPKEVKYIKDYEL
jgi:hypothetical protein